MRLLSVEDLRNRGIGFSDTHLRRLIDAGRFPKPVAPGLKRRAWVESEIDNWMEELVADRDGPLDDS